MSASSLARQSQLSSGYAVDVWLDVELQPMMKLWQGHGGHSNFFLSEEDAREARGSYQGSMAYKVAEYLWRRAQVAPSEKHGYRSEIVEFVVDMPTPAAIGICHANPALGAGSVLQYYVPDWGGNLYRTGRRHAFQRTSY
ncbi:MAG: hypothetical protein B7733_24885 [Myxococcales bacterium FL481]|nr:MAG: hypothetical protein B7733_24885 [Myxococcales bacterium FL481]